MGGSEIGIGIPEAGLGGGWWIELSGADVLITGLAATGSWDGLFFFARLLGFTCILPIKVEG